MKHIGVVFCIVFFLGLSCVLAQVSADCANAVPICSNTPVNGGTNGFGFDDFNGAATSGCLEKTITDAIESNSAWYRFRTGASGQLGINIGINAAEDWDFALYKTSDCANLGDPIRCNFFDNNDQNTFVGFGEDPTGATANIQYEDWIQVTPGEEYYLLINNFSNSNSGFSIQFSGSIFVTNPYDALDCSIINNLLGPPISACEGDTIILDATTNNAITYNWFKDEGNGFQSIAGQNDPTLSVSASALYRVEVVLPSGSTVISDVQIGFSIMPIANLVLNDASCSGMDTYDLSQKDSEVLGAQNTDAFVVSYHTSLADANSGIHPLPKQYSVQTGTQTIFVRLGSAENPNCYDVSQQFQLTNLQTPLLDFPAEGYLCNGGSSVIIGQEISNSNYSYVWNTGQITSSIQVSQAGTYSITVTNTQAGLSCSSSKSVTVVVSNPPVITDIEIEDLQNNNTVTVLATSTENWEYKLDDGEYQSHSVFRNVLPGAHTVTVNDPKGCGSVSEEIIVVGFPKFFTPNGDDNNDEWQIEGISNLENPVVSIYDRYGKLLKQLTSSSFGWDGTLNGKTMPSSDYWFKLTYVDTNGQLATAKYINNHFSLKR